MIDYGKKEKNPGWTKFRNNVGASKTNFFPIYL